MKLRFYFSALLLSLLLLFSNSSLIAKSQKPDRIEPPFWWIGMKNQKLQLLVKGKNISETTPVIKYNGVTIEKTHKGDSPNYLFIDLLIAPATKAGDFRIKFKKGKKTKFTSRYSLKQRDPESEFRKGFSSSDVMYLFMPDRFANGNPDNDNTLSTAEIANRKDMHGRHGGDIQGVVNNLDYLSELGITAIWSTPVLEDNCPESSYHGYAISDYYKIDPRYGSNKEYKEMIDKCHKRGIKVVMDMISNHCGSAHWWMNDLPFKDWLNNWDSFTRSNHVKKTMNDPHASESDKNAFINGWFDTTMPDLNQKNPFLLTYLIQNSIWWVEFSGLDGIRMDTYPYNDFDAMSEWAGAIMKEYPNFNIVGETWHKEAHEIAFWQRNSKNALNYNSHLKTAMDFPLYFAMEKCFNEYNGWDTGMKRLYNSIANDYMYPDLNNLLVFAENHDTPRFNHTVKGNIDKYKMAMAFIATIRGIPQLYYGSEIRMTGDKGKGDGDIRRDFPGGWENDAKNCFKTEGRNEEQIDSFNYLKKLLNWRKNKSVIHTGKLMHYIPYDGIYVYFRYNKNETVMVILNNNNTEKNLDTNRFKESINGFSNGHNIISGKKANLSNIKLAPKSATILELR